MVWETPASLATTTKSHELDFLNLSTGKLGQSISLDRDGPDGIAGMPIWFHQIAVDSILVGNDQQTVYLIDTIGRVVNSYSFRGEGHATASRNARSHIAAFRYDGDAGQIIYPRENDKDLSIAALDHCIGGHHRDCLHSGMDATQGGISHLSQRCLYRYFGTGQLPV